MTRIENIPGPGGSSLGRLRAFHKDPMQLFSSLTQQYGPQVQFTMGPWNFLLLNNPESVGMVLSHYRPHFHKGPGVEPSNPFIGKGLLTSEEEAWVTQRRDLSPVFRPQNVRLMRSDLKAVLTRLIDRLPVDTSINLESEMLSLTLQLVLETLFSSPQDAVAPDPMSRDIQWIMNHFYRRSRSVWRFPYHLPAFNHRYKVKAGRVRASLDAIVPENRPYETVLAHLNPKKPQWYHQALTLIVAGHETTGHALAWAFDLLSQHPRWMAAVLEESRLSQEEVTATSHPLTHAVWQETLRLYPSAWLISRRTLHDFPLGEIAIPKNTFILISPWLMHRNSTYFPEPETFRPERFLGESRLVPYSYIPFGAGPRGCIGEHLATTEALLTLTLLVQRYAITSSGPRGVFPGITLTASYPMWATLKVRQDGT